MQEHKTELNRDEIEEIARRAARQVMEETLDKKFEPPKCTFRWSEEGQLISECETKEDRDLASRLLDEKGVVVKVKVTKEKS
jgi:hypothetical protein